MINPYHDDEYAQSKHNKDYIVNVLNIVIEKTNGCGNLTPDILQLQML